MNASLGLMIEQIAKTIVFVYSVEYNADKQCFVANHQHQCFAFHKEAVQVHAHQNTKKILNLIVLNLKPLKREN